MAANLQSQTFRSFEIYIVVALHLPGAGAGVLGAVRLIYQRALNYPDRR